MKTLTEFSGFVLKEAIAKKAALIAEGKSEEEAQSAINEQLKLDEAKTGFYKNVVDMTSSRVERVKRVVVAVKASETEKVPEAFTEREGHFYLVEYFPTHDARSAGRGARDGDRDFGRGRDGRGGRGGNDRGRGRGPREGGEGRGERRPPRGDRPVGDRPTGATSSLIQTQNANAPKAPRPPRGDKPARGPRPPRGDRPARGPRGPKGAGELRLVLKGQSQTLQGSGGATAPTPETSTESPPSQA